MPTWQREDAYRLIQFFRLTEQCEFDQIMNDLSSSNLEDVSYALRRFSTLAGLWMNHNDYRKIGTIKYAKIRGIEASLKNRMDTEGVGSTSNALHKSSTQAGLWAYHSDQPMLKTSSEHMKHDLSSSNLGDVSYALRRFSTLADLWMNHNDYRKIGTIEYRNLGITEYAKCAGRVLLISYEDFAWIPPPNPATQS